MENDIVMQEVQIGLTAQEQTDYIEVVKIDSPTRVPDQKLYVTLEVKLNDAEGNPRISYDDATLMLETDIAKRIALSKAGQVFARRCGYSEQSQIKRFKDGQPAVSLHDVDAVRITYTILAEL